MKASKRTELVNRIARAWCSMHHAEADHGSAVYSRGRVVVSSPYLVWDGDARRYYRTVRQLTLTDERLEELSSSLALNGYEKEALVDWIDWMVGARYYQTLEEDGWSYIDWLSLERELLAA